MLENVHHIWLGRLLPLSVRCLFAGLAQWMSPMPGDELPPRSECAPHPGMPCCDGWGSLWKGVLAPLGEGDGPMRPGLLGGESGPRPELDGDPMLPLIRSCRFFLTMNRSPGCGNSPAVPRFGSLLPGPECLSGLTRLGASPTEVCWLCLPLPEPCCSASVAVERRCL
jgi:hypothetical protein